MKKIKNIMMKITIAASAIAMPAVALTSCSTSWNTNHIISTFYNAYDMLTALGITPYGQTMANSALKLNYWPYMNSYVDGSKTKFGTFTSSTSEPNLKALASMKIDTLVTNEWDRTNEPTYKKTGFINFIAYTSMADSAAAKYSETAPPGTFEWNDYKEGLFSYRNAFTMLAKDLDKRFLPNTNIIEGQQSAFNSYEERANNIINADKEVMKELRAQFQASILKDKYIGIFAGQGGSGSITPVESITAIQDPFIYPEMYGPETSDIGMGAKFPKPNTISETDAIKFADNGGSLAAIKAKDAGTLKNAFGSKFDKIIFIKSPDQLYNDTITLNGQLNQLKDYLKTTPTETTITQDQTNKNKTNVKDIVIVEYEDWYPTTWGVLGKKHVVKEMLKVFNLFLENENNTTTKNATTTTTFTYPDNKSWNQYKVDQLQSPNKK